tara:strand:- start:1913 stop:2170 length:258 start_codon:yes stop_codon:yes gene_type:complete
MIKEESRLVEKFVSLKNELSARNKEAKIIEAQMKELKSSLRKICEANGKALSSKHQVMIQTQNKSGYTVPAKTFLKYYVSKRESV